MSTRAERVERLFHAALDLDASERRRFLESSCEADTDLRREVEALLELDAGDDARLDAPAPEVLALDGAPTTLLVGKRLGPYRLERCVASGGMGSVYTATQEHPHRAVAIKVLRAEVATPELERRFRIESSFLARLQHAGIAHVYGAEVAELDGVRVPYIAMELVEGARTLLDYARSEGLDARARIELFLRVSDAVHHGHQRGVIHRDLKPGNILVDREGQPKLIDFGIARAVDPEGETLQTVTGTFLGTVQYMSPEQCRDARDLDVRSDVYSLGVVLYELLCERSPYDLAGAPLPEAARIVQEREPRRPSTVARAVRGDLETILLQALAKERERRYQSAAELAEDLRRFLRHEPIAARPPSRAYRAWMFARRNKALVSALAAIVIVSVSAAFVSLAFYLDERRAHERDRRSSAFANIAAADLSLRTFDTAGAHRRLDLVPEDLRRFEWFYLRDQLDLADLVVRGPLSRCEALDARDGVLASAWHYPYSSWIVLYDQATGAECERLEVEPFTVTRLALARDGSVVFGGHRGELRRWTPATGQVVELETHPEGEWWTGVRVVGDQVLASSTDGSLRAWDLASGRRLDAIVEGAPAWRDLAVRGSRLVLAGSDGTILVSDLDGASPSVLQHGSVALAVDLDLTGGRVASAGMDGDLLVWDLAAAAPPATLAGHTGAVQDLILLDGGARTLSVSEDRTVRVWDLSTGSAAVLLGHENLVKCVELLDGGARFATGGYDGTLRIWDSDAAPGGRSLGTHGAYVRHVAFSPDGGRLATASRDGTARVFDSRDGRELLRIEHGASVGAIDFDSGGRLLATATEDPMVRLWDAETGESAGELGGHGGEVHALAFHPSDELLASGDLDGRIVLHAVAERRGEGTAEVGASVQQLAFDPTGERLVSVDNDGHVFVLDARTLEEIWSRDCGVRVHDAAFGPGGESLAVAAGEYDGTESGALLFDGRTGAPRGAIRGHSDFVHSVAWTSEGDRLVTTSADATVRLWDGETLEEVLVLRGHESWVWDAALSPDGQTLATADGPLEGGAGGVRLWSAPR